MDIAAALFLLALALLPAIVVTGIVVAVWPANPRVHREDAPRAARPAHQH